MYRREKSLTQILVDVFYASTFLDLLNNHKLNPKLKIARTVTSIISFITGLYMFISLILMKQNCEYSGFSYLIGDWLPFLEHKSRTIVYRILFSLVASSFIIRFIVLIEYFSGHRMKMDYLNYYVSNSDREYSQEDKFNIFIERYETGEEYPIFIERTNNFAQYRSTCIFWFKDTFKFLDKYSIFIFINTIFAGLYVNVGFWIFFLYFTYSSVEPDSPNFWELADDLGKKVSFDGHMCQVRASKSSRFIFTIIITNVVIDTGIQICLISLIFIIKVSIAILWTIKVNQALSRLVKLYNQYSTLLKHKPTKVEERKFSLINNRVPYLLTANLTCEKLSLTTRLLSILSETRKFTRYQEPQLEYYHVNQTTTQEFRESYELMNAATKNEVLALLFFIIGSDEYIAIICFTSTLGSFFALSLGYMSIQKSDLLIDNLAILCLLFAGSVILTVSLGGCATVNARIMHLHHKIAVLMASSDENRKFWKSISNLWFDRDGLRCGYTIFGVTKISWDHYLQVSWHNNNQM